MSQITVIDWNVYIRHDVHDVHFELMEMIHQHGPDVIVLQEAKHLYGRLSGLGYKVYQLKPMSDDQKHRKGYRRAAGNIAILLRSNHKPSGIFTMLMHRFWRGPKLGAMQDPRVYRWVRFKKNNVVWKIAGWHFPFGGKARHETIRRVRRWFKHSWPGRPVIGIGDYNLPKPAVRKSIADPVGARMAGYGIDLAVYKNCLLVEHAELGRHGSDHPAVLFVFEKNGK